MSIQRDDVRRSFRESPLRRLLAEGYTFWLVFRPHDENHDGRKAITILVVGVWAIMEVGSAFGAATLPDQFFFIRLVVGVLIGRMWGIEINNFAGVEFAYDHSDDSSNPSDSNGGDNNGNQ